MQLYILYFYVFIIKNVDNNSKVLFAEHLGLAEIQKGVRAGRFMQGTLLISRENYLEAFVSVKDQEKMVICFPYNNFVLLSFKS